MPRRGPRRAGRTPRTAGIGLEGLGIEAGKPRSRSRHLRVPGHDWLYVVGDANGRVLLTHMGKYQARLAADAICGERAPAAPRRAVAAGDVHRAAGRVGRLHARLRREGGHRRALRRRRRRRPTRRGASRQRRRGDVADGRRRGPPGDRRLDVRRAPTVGELLHAATIAVVGRGPARRPLARRPGLPDAARCGCGCWRRTGSNQPGVSAPRTRSRPLSVRTRCSAICTWASGPTR